MTTCRPTSHLRMPRYSRRRRSLLLINAGPPGARLTAVVTSRMASGGRFEQHYGSDFRLRRWYGLSRLALYRGWFRACRRRYDWGLANALGNGRSDAFQVGAYGITWFGPAYLAGALAFTNHWFTTSRSALGDQLIANLDGQSYGARFEAGYRYGVLPTFGVTPYGALQLGFPYA